MPDLSIETEKPEDKTPTSAMWSTTMEEAEVLIQFDLGKVDLAKLYEIQKLFREMGISFDSGAGGGVRDWEWDWSLKGPVKVFLKTLVKDNADNRYAREHTTQPDIPDSDQGKPLLNTDVEAPEFSKDSE